MANGNTFPAEFDKNTIKLKAVLAISGGRYKFSSPAICSNGNQTTLTSGLFNFSKS